MKTRSRSLMRRLWRQPAGLLLAAFLCLLAIGGSAPRGIAPERMNLSEKLLPPSRQHLLGTDQYGRDQLARILDGSRRSVGAAVVVLGGVLIAGLTAGIAAGMIGGWVETIAMRSIDVMLAVPSLVLALAISGLLGGIERPTQGTISFGGTLLPGAVMPIFQDPVGSLDARWPVWRTLTEPLLAGHRPDRSGREARRRIARERLAAVGLAEIDLEARPAELSVGQCQRIAIQRALIAEPAVLLADEPTSALDAVHAVSIMRMLEAAAEAGAAIVLVSHDEQLLQAYCHRVLYMQDGQIRQGV